MSRFLNGPVIGAFLGAAVVIVIFVFAGPRVGVSPSRAAVPGRLLQEREAFQGPSGQRLLAATPSAIRKDAGVSRSSSSYQVDWHARYERLLHAHKTAAHVWHKRLARLLRQLERARTVQAHVEGIPWPWVAIVDCESGDGDGQPPYAADWGYNGPSGFDGGPQFEPGTWSAYRRPGDPPFAYQASPAAQVAVAERVLADQGWGAWPVCSRKVGLR